MSSGPFRVLPGEPFPAGASVTPTGVNFTVFSRNATALSLILYERVGDAVPLQVIDLDPVHNRTFFFWHALVEGATWPNHDYCDGKGQAIVTGKLDGDKFIVTTLRTTG